MIGILVSKYNPGGSRWIIHGCRLRSVGNSSTTSESSEVVLEKTLMHEFHISNSHTERYLLFLLCESNKIGDRVLLNSLNNWKFPDNGFHGHDMQQSTGCQ